jgi:hypothetical protein
MCVGVRARDTGFMGKTYVLFVVVLGLLLVAGTGGVAAGATGAQVSGHLTKTSFTAAQAGSVKLTYRFSKTSSRFSTLLTFQKGSGWQTVKSVKKTGWFKGSHTVTVKSLFAGKLVNVGRYRLKLAADQGSTLLRFTVLKASTGGAPANTALPTISGTPTQGETLTAADGSWSNAPTAYAYQWRRCNSAGASCANISGAGSGSYTLASADVGSTIRVIVTASNAHGSASATSSQTTVVTAPPSIRPQAGTWVTTSLSGPVSGGGGAGSLTITSMSFEVGTDQATVGTFGFNFTWYGTPGPPSYNCGGSGDSVMTSGNSSPITNGNFSSPNPTGAWSGRVSGFANGTFDTATSAHGTATANGFVGGGSGCYFQSGLSAQTGTFSWTAAWQPAATPQSTRKQEQLLWRPAERYLAVTRMVTRSQRRATPRSRRAWSSARCSRSSAGSPARVCCFARSCRSPASWAAVCSSDAARLAALAAWFC